MLVLFDCYECIGWSVENAHNSSSVHICMQHEHRVWPSFDHMPESTKMTYHEMNFMPFGWSHQVHPGTPTFKAMVLCSDWRRF